MTSRTALWFLGIGILAASVACAVRSEDDAEGSSSRVMEATFDPNNVIDDRTLSNVEALSAEDLQTFLESKRSVLATYEENGKSASVIMHDVAVKHGINPMELLVRAQMEQGLVTKKTASDAIIAKAFGCGCPGTTCNPKYAGLENQAECAAGTLRRQLDKATSATGTVTGWKRGKAKKSEDNLEITPKNAATAALYTYTPWVGEAGGGKKGIGGTSLHHVIWESYAKTLDKPTKEPSTPDPKADEEEDASAPPTDPDAGVEAGPSNPPTGDSDAGTPKGSGSDAGASTAASPPPEDGSEDGDIIGDGSTTPSSNGPTNSGGEEYSSGGEDGLKSKKKNSDEGGCRASPSNASNGVLVFAAVALTLVRARRRRRA